MLIDYLVGTEEEGRDSGDIGNTEKIFIGQLAKAKELGMLTSIRRRMDGLCATTEMEWNGLLVDTEEAKRRLLVLEQDFLAASEDLEQYIPELPDGCEFDWGKKNHVSALLFGGAFKYQKWLQHTDEQGNLLFTKAYEARYMLGGKPIPDKYIGGGENGERLVIHPVTGDNLGECDKFKSGKRVGEYRTRRVEVQGKPKGKIHDLIVDLPGQVPPDPDWETANIDPRGNPYYGTGKEVMKEVEHMEVPFCKKLQKRNALIKEIGTYYLRWDPKKKAYVGMLTCVDPKTHIIHHKLNHTSTVPTRLSASDPNMQNIPRQDKSEVKKMFISRFGDDGVMIEIDYSQLEVVVQGVLTGDLQLCEDLRNRVDFHCKRVAIKNHITYEEAVEWCKNEDNPDYKAGKKERTKCKIFSFQRAYGAGPALIAKSTGMTVPEVEALIAGEEATYPKTVEFDEMLEKAILHSAVPFYDATEGKSFRRGTWQCATGTLYSWRSYPCKFGWQRKQGIKDTFSPTERKNYPVQGTGGEIVQAQLGRLWRECFVATSNYGGLAFLVNTVHDCEWTDCHRSIKDQVIRDSVRVLEDVATTFPELNITVPFPVDAEFGPNMYDLHGWEEAA